MDNTYYAYAWIGNTHSNSYQIRCNKFHNNLQGREYSTTAEKWSSFIAVAIFEIYSSCF